ncbi:hypothetical protein AALB47_20990 [Lachnospiraceae bacterium 54-11]
MSKLIKVKSDNTLDLSIEDRLFKNIRKAQAWYTSSAIGIAAFLGFAVLDIAGFWQIAKQTIPDSNETRFLIIASLAVAFEVAPLYIGYSICLKCYRLGMRIHNWVLAFSCSACILGIVGNIFFRIKTMDVAYYIPGAETVSDIALPITVLLCILPVITSLMSLVIGCLTFDPLQFDLLKLSKKLAKLKSRRQQIKAFLEEFNDETVLKETIERDETACYESVKKEIYALQTSFKTYVIVKTFSSS